MSLPTVPLAASSLLAEVFDSPAEDAVLLLEVARTTVSVHYDTGRDVVPVLCICTPAAVRLPNAAVSSTLPTGEGLVAYDGRLHGPTATWKVARWWQPPRPRGLSRPTSNPTPSSGVDLDPAALVGRGPGLTPEGDDVVAGALVAAHATDDPRLVSWRAATRRALATHGTTAVSRGLLQHAMDGYATVELADYLEALCNGRDARVAERRLLAVGHSSGAALAAGARHTLFTQPLRGAA